MKVITIPILTILYVLISSKADAQRVEVINMQGDTIQSVISSIDAKGIYASPRNYKFKDIQHIIFLETPQEEDFNKLKQANVSYSVGYMPSPTRLLTEENFKILIRDYENYKIKKTVALSLEAASTILFIVAIYNKNEKTQDNLLAAGLFTGVLGLTLNITAGIPIRLKLTDK